MSIRPAHAAGGPPTANRLAAVLATGLRVRPAVKTGVVYSDEPPNLDVVEILGEEGEYGPDPYPRDDPRWGNDFQWVVERVRKQAFNYVLASKEFRRSRELAIVALERGGQLLKYMSPAFKNDRELAKLAIQTFAEAYKFISYELKRDDELIRATLAKEDKRYIFYLLPEDLKHNHEYMLMAAKSDYENFSAFPEAAQRDRQFVMQLIAKEPLIATIDRVSQLYTDEEFWVAAVRASAYNVKALPMTIPRTRASLLRLTRANGGVLLLLIGLQELGPKLSRGNPLPERVDWKMDLKALYENDPEFRLAMATAEKEPNMDMVSAILNDVEAAINVLMKERLLAKTDAMKRARLERFAGYETLLGTLAAGVRRWSQDPDRKFELKIEELVALLNDPERSADFHEYRIKKAMDDMQFAGEERAQRTALLNDPKREERAQKRKRETDAFAAGAALPRLPV